MVGAHDVAEGFPVARLGEEVVSGWRVRWR